MKTKPTPKKAAAEQSEEPERGFSLEIESGSGAHGGLEKDLLIGAEAQKEIFVEIPASITIARRMNNDWRIWTSIANRN